MAEKAGKQVSANPGKRSTSWVKKVIWSGSLLIFVVMLALLVPQADLPMGRMQLVGSMLAFTICTWSVISLSLQIFSRGAPSDAVSEQIGLVPKTVEPKGLEYTDPLTSLGNTQRMVEKFKTLKDRYNSPEDGFLIGLADMDGMKPINELYGFDSGDQILKQCAQRLSAALHGEGYVFRMRGDEFGFLLPDVKSHEGAHEIGRILQDVIAAPFDVDGSLARLSGSFGFALYPEAGGDLDEVMKNLESALYHSKRGGHGRVTIFSREIQKLMLERARMEQALRSAVAKNEVRPHFQPIISLQDGKLLGFEALARWIDPELGFVSPAKFVPLAEERGIIASLTDKLLLHAARVAAGWPDELFLSFNLSSVQLVDPTTADTIVKTIEKAGLPPQRLEIEVTETAMMSDPQTASMIIEKLHDAGVRISMDDFGTGQSSLGRLRELKLDKVKIDRAFIMALGEDKPAEHIVRAILEMCAGLDLTVVAEGIEEMNQAESLKHYGCHAGQGYLFGKPQDEHRTMGYIREFMATPSLERPAEGSEQPKVA